MYIYIYIYLCEKWYIYIYVAGWVGREVAGWLGGRVPRWHVLPSVFRHEDRFWKGSKLHVRKSRNRSWGTQILIEMQLQNLRAARMHSASQEHDNS